MIRVLDGEPVPAGIVTVKAFSEACVEPLAAEQLDPFAGTAAAQVHAPLRLTPDGKLSLICPLTSVLGPLLVIVKM